MNTMKRLNRKIKTEEYIEKYLYNFGQERDLKIGRKLRWKQLYLTTFKYVCCIVPKTHYMYGFSQVGLDHNNHKLTLRSQKYDPI